MKETHIIKSEEKIAQWGDGEWVNEPDLCVWEYRECKCIIRRMMAYESDGQLSLGQLNGYVKVPEGHPWHGKNCFDEIDVDVHQGLSFGKFNDFGEYIIGFDCAHSGDIIPSMNSLFAEKKAQKLQFLKDLDEDMKKKYPNCSLFNPIYRNIAFVKAECESLVDQMLAVKVK